MRRGSGRALSDATALSRGIARHGALVFAGTGAIVINDVSSGAITHAGIAATFGLIVMAMIYCVGDVSGAHFNPAVTLAFWAARRLEGAKVGPYLAAQTLGALLASPACQGVREPGCCGRAGA